MRSSSFVFVTILAFAALCFAAEQQCARVRRSWASMSRSERDLYLDALQEAYNRGGYQIFAQTHVDNFPDTHATSLFLPWHRWFVYRFETYLRGLGSRYSCLTIPYWSWESTSDLGTNYLFNRADLGSRVSGCVSDSRFSSWRFSSQCIRRTWPSTVSLCGEACTVDSITSSSRFSTFARSFETRPHASPHNWCGGNLATTISCRDPIFFFIHSNVDRMWAMWQDCKDQDRVSSSRLTSDNYAPSSSDYGIDDCMPFQSGSRYFGSCVTPRMVHHIQGNTEMDMEYSYDDANGMRSILNSNFRRCNWDWGWPGSGSSSSSPPPSSSSGSSGSSDACSGFDGSCDECTNEDGCGWCGSHSTCRPGTSSGPDDRSCSTSWRWNPRDCSSRKRSTLADDTTPAEPYYKVVSKNSAIPEKNPASHPSYPPPDRRTRLMPGYKGNYFYKKVGGKPPSDQLTYVKGPGMFCNFYVQNAKMQIDAYYTVNKNLTNAGDYAHRIHMYDIAECDLEGVEKYVTDAWLKVMGMEHRKQDFVPVCHVEKLPLNVSSEYTL